MNDNLKQGARQQESIKPKELLKGSVLKPLGKLYLNYTYISKWLS